MIVQPATRVHFMLRVPDAATRPARVSLRITDPAGTYVGSAHDLLVDTADGCAFTRGLAEGSYLYEANIRPEGAPVRGTFEVAADAEPRVDVQLQR